ncbi:MAG TPA: Ig-like domain-containing protein [Solirubrobacteraceae bacterium]|nr:Ig-like domain-containing protein [Solirubrobacteraceae bacterium]
MALGIAWTAPSGASAAAFGQCPATYKDTGCQFLITVTNSGVQVAEDSTQGPYDGDDDSLVGIVNNSSKSISSIPISAEEDVFGFDGDGPCNPYVGVNFVGYFEEGKRVQGPGCVIDAENAAGEALKAAGKPCPTEERKFKETPTVKEEKEKAEAEEEYDDPCGFPSPSGEPAGVTFEAGAFDGYSSSGDEVTGYEGPRNWYSNIGVGANSGVVNFSPALAPGESTYFGLESALTGKILTIGNGTTISTGLSGGGQSGSSITVVQGTPVTDSATLAGSGAAVATGEVSYELFTNETCTAGATSAGSAAVSGPSVGPSVAEGSLAPGKYYWVAHYSGDVNNQKVSSACGSEVLTVLAPTTTTTTQSAGVIGGASLTVPAGTTVTDQAHIAGSLAASATGTVTYALYDDSTCTGPTIATSTVTVAAGVAAVSTAIVPKVGTYYWRASYSGDGANAASASTCGSEVLVVALKASLGLPAASQCLARRGLTVHLSAPKKVRFVSYEIQINGVTVQSGKLRKHQSTVSYSPLPKGSFVFALITKSSRGKLYEQLRKFHRCPRAKHKKK